MIFVFVITPLILIVGGYLALRVMRGYQYKQLQTKKRLADGLIEVSDLPSTKAKERALKKKEKLRKRAGRQKEKSAGKGSGTSYRTSYGSGSGRGYNADKWEGPRGKLFSKDFIDEAGMAQLRQKLPPLVEAKLTALAEAHRERAEAVSQSRKLSKSNARVQGLTPPNRPAKTNLERWLASAIACIQEDFESQRQYRAQWQRWKDSQFSLQNAHLALNRFLEDLERSFELATLDDELEDWLVSARKVHETEGPAKLDEPALLEDLAVADELDDEAETMADELVETVKPLLKAFGLMHETSADALSLISLWSEASQVPQLPVPEKPTEDDVARLVGAAVSVACNRLSAEADAIEAVRAVPPLLTGCREQLALLKQLVEDLDGLDEKRRKAAKEKYLVEVRERRELADRSTRFDRTTGWSSGRKQEIGTGIGAGAAEGPQRSAARQLSSSSGNSSSSGSGIAGAPASVAQPSHSSGRRFFGFRSRKQVTQPAAGAKISRRDKDTLDAFIAAHADDLTEYNAKAELASFGPDALVVSFPNKETLELARALNSAIVAESFSNHAIKLSVPGEDNGGRNGGIGATNRGASDYQSSWKSGNQGGYGSLGSWRDSPSYPSIKPVQLSDNAKAQRFLAGLLLQSIELSAQQTSAQIVEWTNFPHLNLGDELVSNETVQAVVRKLRSAALRTSSAELAEEAEGALESNSSAAAYNSACAAVQAAMRKLGFAVGQQRVAAALLAAAQADHSEAAEVTPVAEPGLDTASVEVYVQTYGRFRKDLQVREQGEASRNARLAELQEQLTERTAQVATAVQLLHERQEKAGAALTGLSTAAGDQLDSTLEPVLVAAEILRTTEALR